MDVEQFRKSTTGRVVKVGEGGLAYWAFVPHPLPPAVEFTLELVHELSEADRALGELVGLAQMLPNPALLARPFAHREAVSSSRIEGTEAAVTDLYAYEAGHLPLRTGKPSLPEADVREVLNYVRALDYGLERAETLPISLRLIREVHERLMEGVRGGHATPGEFRRTQNWIGSPGCTLDDATYVPPPVPEMREALGAFEKYLHQDDLCPPLMRLALIHCQFESIHPFVDGNGRVGRLLIAFLMVHWKLLPQPLLYLSSFFERRREEYYSLLDGVRSQGAWDQWVSFFLQAVVEQSRDTIARARRLQEVQAAWRERLLTISASARLLQLAESLFEAPVLAITDAQKLLGVSNRSARLNVEKLLNVGILRQVGDGDYGRTYVAGEVLDILE
jgi:Fic family protein